MQLILNIICVLGGCEDYNSWNECELNSCEWQNGRNYCFGRKNESIKYYEVHSQIDCEYNDFNITEPLDVRLSVDNNNNNNTNNNSYKNCSELSSSFSFIGGQNYISYGTFDQCTFNTNDINETSIKHIHIFCVLNNVWEPCVKINETDYIGLTYDNTTSYFCECGQLQYTQVPNVIYHGGLSHHGYYIQNLTKEELIDHILFVLKCFPCFFIYSEFPC